MMQHVINTKNDYLKVIKHLDIEAQNFLKTKKYNFEVDPFSIIYYAG